MSLENLLKGIYFKLRLILLSYLWKPLSIFPIIADLSGYEPGITGSESGKKIVERRKLR